MKVQLRLFAMLKDFAGFDAKEIDLPEPASAGHVIDVLVGMDGRFEQWRGSLRLAVNEEYVAENHALKQGDEVAVIPPVSGG